MKRIFVNLKTKLCRYEKIIRDFRFSKENLFKRIVPLLPDMT